MHSRKPPELFAIALLATVVLSGDRSHAAIACKEEKIVIVHRAKVLGVTVIKNTATQINHQCVCVPGPYECFGPGQCAGAISYSRGSKWIAGTTNLARCKRSQAQCC